MWIFQKDFGIIMNKCVYWNRFTVFISSNQAFFVLIVVVLKMCVGPHSALREIITNCDNLPWCPVYLIWILNFNTCTFQTLTHDFTKSSKKKKEGKCNTCGYMQMLLWVSISHSKQFKTTPFLLKLLRPSVRRRGCFNQTAFWVTLSLKS